VRWPQRRAPAPTDPPPSKQPTRYIGLDTVKPGGFLVELDPTTPTATSASPSNPMRW